ncbi:MAG: hypothetical protein R2774_14930 [Saprospiraceae bacterium]
MKYRNHILLIFLFLSILNFKSISQNNKIDALKRELSTPNLGDSIRLDILCNLCWELVVMDALKVKDYENELKTLEDRVFGIKGYFKVKIVLGYYYYKGTGNLDLALQYFL